MFVFLGSEDSILLYPANTSCEFLSDLGGGIELTGNWCCGLVSCDIGNIAEELLVHCDIVQQSSVYGKLIPILTTVKQSGSVSYPYYIPVTRDYIHRIRIRLLTREGNTPSTKPTHCNIVLHLTKKKQ